MEPAFLVNASFTGSSLLRSASSRDSLTYYYLEVWILSLDPPKNLPKKFVLSVSSFFSSPFNTSIQLQAIPDFSRTHTPLASRINRHAVTLVSFHYSLKTAEVSPSLHAVHDIVRCSLKNRPFPHSSWTACSPTKWFKSTLEAIVWLCVEV